MQARLSYVQGGAEVAVEVDRDPFPIGRTKENALVLPGAGVSRRHCELRRRGAGWEVLDLGSTRGTQLNGEPLPAQEARPLQDGDELQVGVHALRFAAPAASEVEPSDERDEEPRPLELLLDTIAELHRHLDPLELLPVILDRVLELTGAERGLLLLRGASGELETTVARGAGEGDLPRVEGTSQSVPQRVLETGTTVAIGADDWARASQSMRDHALRSILCVPIRLHGNVRGVIYVDSQQLVGELGPRQQLLVEALAAQCAIALERAHHLREEAAERARAEAENTRLRAERDEPERPLAASPAMEAALRRLERVADADLSVLITGETGVGKEVCARYLHARSHRRQRPFVVVDCGAVPEQLLESVLFGHVRGAFTGATADSEGLCRRADGGTLLLDEVGELPLALQPKLLRFLEEQTVLPVGSSERVQVDVRVIACTHRDLEAMARAGTFREDLYFRLNAFPLEVPPLRERREDLEPLARLLLARARAAARTPRVVAFTHEALAAIRSYEWPGNVRELANRIQRAAVTAEPPFITVTDLDLAAAPEDAVGVLPLKEARQAASSRFEQEYVTELLRRHRGRVQKAAQEAGVSRQMFQRLMARHGISRESFLPGED
ncbi:MAG: sigma 54-interacting transcriptional regulator [Planctomycetota bacterium]